MKFSEERLQLFAAPLSESEDQKCKNVIGMVRDALKELGLTDDNKAISRLYEDTYAYALNMRGSSDTRQIKIFIQGSYANNTNVRTQSDVDIAIVQEDTFQTKYRFGTTKESYGFTDVDLPSKTFKDEIQECLMRKFGGDVERKNKSIKVHGNTYRKDADTVPCQRYRDYSQDFRNDTTNFIGGIVIKADDGTRIINYPEQHIANGRRKNSDTNFYYKKMVRIMKNIRYLMEENNLLSAKNISSFVLESLLWNIPNEIFNKYNPILKYTFDEIIKFLHSHKQEISTYKEANGIKELCPSQLDTTKLIQFIDDLFKFYEYDI